MKKYISTCLLWIVLIARLSASTNDPLPSWNESVLKTKIIQWVGAVCDENSEQFVKEEERVAVMDLDGTLIAEWPINFQRALAVKRLQEMGARDAQLGSMEPFLSAMSDNHYFFNHKNNHSFVFLKAFNHMTQRSYESFVNHFLAEQRDGYWGLFYHELFYQPAIELIELLQANKFKVFICSTTELECIRELLFKRLKLPPNQIIGNEVVKKVVEMNGKLEFVFTDSFRTPENRSEQKCTYFDYAAGKPALLAFGNSAGDYHLLRLAHERSANSLILVLDHDDSRRELVYADDFLLQQAKKHQWDVISMKQHFKNVFSVEPRADRKYMDIAVYLK